MEGSGFRGRELPKSRVIGFAPIQHRDDLGFREGNGEHAVVVLSCSSLDVRGESLSLILGSRRLACHVLTERGDIIYPPSGAQFLLWPLRPAATRIDDCGPNTWLKSCFL